jgi:peptide deformylase
MTVETGQTQAAGNGAARAIVVMPDPLLTRIARPCSWLDDRTLAVASDLVATMRSHAGCVGLAAPQIGELLRVIVVDVTAHPRAVMAHGELILLNPEVVMSTGTQMGREGCLSLPGLTANVRRAARVVITGLSTEGEEILLDTQGFEARVLQHELDHLDGILIHDRVETFADLFPRGHATRQHAHGRPPAALTPPR